jgi:hypothetical protein
VVAYKTVALANLSGWVEGLSGVGVSCVARVGLHLASALRLSAPMLLGVSLVPLCNASNVADLFHPVSARYSPHNNILVKTSASSGSFNPGWKAQVSKACACKRIHPPLENIPNSGRQRTFNSLILGMGKCL